MLINVTLILHTEDTIFLESRTAGLYPAQNFWKNNPEASGFDGDDVIGSTENYILVRDGNDTKIYIKNIIGGSAPYEATDEMDGVIISYAEDTENKVLKAIDEDGNIYTMTSNGIVSSTQTVGSGVDTGSEVYFDGVSFYYFFDGDIYRQITDFTDPDTQTIDPVFQDYGFGSVVGVEEYGNDLGIFIRRGVGTQFLLWDKQDNTVLVDKVHMNDDIFIASGILDGVLVMIAGVQRSRNNVESVGEIVVQTYTGHGFKPVKIIKSGSVDFNLVAKEGFSYNSTHREIIFDFKTANGTNHEEVCRNNHIQGNYIYRVTNHIKEGLVIDTILEYSDTQEVQAISSEYGAEKIVLKDTNGDLDYFQNTDFNSCRAETWGDGDWQFEDSFYITNFYEKTANHHVLDGVGMTVEKMIEDDEAVEVYYRTSERDEFKLIENITYDIIKDNTDQHMSEDRIDSEDNPDNVALSKQMIYLVDAQDHEDEPNIDEYHEIQFMFKLTHGMSIINAWRVYNYNTRNYKI